MIRSASAVTAASIAASLSCAQPSFGQEETDQRFGTVHFATSCNETAQRRFDRAMRYQHSFWYGSRRRFRGSAQGRPGMRHRLLGDRAEPAQQSARAAAGGQPAARAGRAREGQGGRCEDTARTGLHRRADRVLHRLTTRSRIAARVQAYLKAMEALAQRYPDDDEAQIVYAIALNVAASPNDKTYANQLKGAAILEPIFKRQPRHPGVAHYLIHLYDNPAIAEKGLDAAKRYAEIAPAAPHAQHMPSHIFTRVGYWKESIASNTASARAAKAGKKSHDQLHAMDYMVYAYLQLGQDSKAQAVRRRDARHQPASTETFIAGPYALAASPARYMVERGDWKGAASCRCGRASSPMSTP